MSLNTKITSSFFKVLSFYTGSTIWWINVEITYHGLSATEFQIFFQVMWNCSVPSIDTVIYHLSKLLYI